MMVFLLSAAAMLAAQSTEAPASTASAVEQPKAEKKICQKQGVTGSLTQKRRICMTQREWDRLRDATRDTVKDYIDKATSVPAVG